MDRFIVYQGENIYEEDVLKSNLFPMIGLGRLIDCLIGNTTSLNRLACTPSTPADLNVHIGPGEIYMLENVDNTPYGSLPADTTHQVMKQGLIIDSVTIPITPPGTTGFSQDYLIQFTYNDIDGFSENRTFYNAVPQVVTTVRQGVCTVNAKAGTAAITGTQVPPAPDAGFIGGYVVTVANGQTQITSGDIAIASGAPFIIEKLQDKISLATANSLFAALAQFTNSLTTTGYQQLPGGFILQWGFVNVPAGSHVDQPYPITFPNAPLQGSATAGITSDSTSPIGAGIDLSPGTSNVRIYNRSSVVNGFAWMVVGN